MLIHQPDHMKSVRNYACIGKPLSNQPPIGRIHVDADHFNFVPTLQRLQKIAHIGGAAPLYYIKDSAAGQIAKRGRKALPAGKSVLINAQNARACAVCPVAALVLHHLVVVALHAGYAYAVLVGDVLAGNTFVVGLKNVALEQLCCSAPHFYACKSGIEISAAVFTSVFMAAN